MTMVALCDVAVGVGDEVEQLAVDADERGSGVGGVDVAVDEVAGEGAVVGRFRDGHDGEGLVVGVGVVVEELRGGEPDRGALVDVEVVGLRIGDWAVSMVPVSTHTVNVPVLVRPWVSRMV